jgi:hypothetical protein
VADLAADADGNAPAFIDLGETGRVLRFEKLPATPPATLAAGAALVGRYRSADMGADGEISIEGEKLILTLQAAYGRTVHVLEALADTVFTAAGGMLPGFSIGLTVLPDGTGFHLNSGRSRHIRFVRAA